MKYLLACAGVVAAAFFSGCGGNVIVGDAGSGGEGGSGGGASTGGTDGGNAIVLEQGTVEFRFMSVPLTCQNPDPFPPGCGWWELSITLPDASLFTPGVIDLESVAATVSFQEVGQPQSSDPNDCPGGGGIGGTFPGTLEIHAVTSDHADVMLFGFNDYFLEAKPDGAYSALRCP